MKLPIRARIIPFILNRRINICNYQRIMPSNRQIATNKRKASEDDHDEAGSTSNVKKVKPPPKSIKSGGASTTREGFAENGQPTNKTIPTEIHFPEKNADSVRIASWNVSGLAASLKKGFASYVEAEEADILILTETKTNEETTVEVLKKRYPHKYWAIASKKGYAGTAVFSKFEALSVTKDLPGHPDESAVSGRIATLEFEKFYLIATYVTNAGQNLKTLKEKETWNEHFEQYVRDLDAKKPVIWVGDLNVAPTEKDLTHAKRNWNKTPGYTESETKAFARILDPSFESKESKEKENSQKLIDVWRHLHPDDHHYTYFSYRFDCRSKGLGWRLDMFVLSERLLDNVKMCEIRSEIYGASDHCPVVMEISGLL